MKKKEKDIIHNLVDRRTGKPLTMNDAAWKINVENGSSIHYKHISSEDRNTREPVHMGGMAVNNVLAYRPPSVCGACGG